MRRVDLKPIGTAELPRIGEFLHANLNQRLTAEEWSACLQAPWRTGSGNHGYMLAADDMVVGAYVAFYAQRSVAGRTERVCNLAAWCVLPEYRFHSLRLLKALLAQSDCSFTDLSPSGNAVQVNARLNFQFLPTATRLVVNLPWPPFFGGARVETDPAVIENLLTGRDLEIYRDHATAAAAHHVVLRRKSELCYVMFRRDRRKRLPIFASLLYVSNPTLYRRMICTFCRHVLLRHGAVATLVDYRVAPVTLWPAVAVQQNRPKMFKSDRVKPADVDYLYSELACVPW
jgi:hypothetical protein